MEYSEYLQNQPLGVKKHFISGDSGNDSDRDSENPEDVQEQNQRISSLSHPSNPLAQDQFEASEEQNFTNDYEITNMTIKKEPGDFSYAGEVDLNYETAVVSIKKEPETKEPSSDEQRTDDEYAETIPVKRQRDFESENTTKCQPVVSGRMKYREGFEDQKISSESSDSSDDESGPESGFHAGSGEEDESDGETVSKGKKSDDSGSKVPLVNRIVKTKGELGLEDLPPIDDLQITVDENVYIYEIGSVSACVGLLVVVQAIEDAPALNVDSILFMENRQVLGKVFEVLGPVAKPLYTVRFNSADDIEAKGIKEGTQVFYVPDKDEFTKFVFLAELKKMKGSDASWENNNEPPAKFLDYSDDESERRAKKGERGGGGENGDIASKCAKRQKERSGKFSKVQDGQTKDGTVNNRNSNKRSRKPFQSWPPQPGDFSESADFPAPAPPQEFPSDYPGFQMQQARPFQPDNSVHFQGPSPHSESRGFHGPPPRNPCFRPGVQGTQSFRPSCPVNGDFRCPSNHGDPRFANQLPPRCNGPPITDQAQPNFARPPGPPHRFGGRPQFNASRFPCQQNLSQPHQHPHGNNMGNNNHHMNQNRPPYQWGNTNKHPPQFFDQPQDARPRGPSQRPFRPPQGPPGPCQRPLGPPQGPNEPSHRPFGHPQRPFNNCPQSHAYPVPSSNIPSPLPPQQSGTYSSFQDMANTSRPPGQDYNGSGQAPNQPVTGNAPPRPQIVDQRYIQRQT